MYTGCKLNVHKTYTISSAFSKYFTDSIEIKIPFMSIKKNSLWDRLQISNLNCSSVSIVNFEHVNAGWNKYNKVNVEITKLIIS